MDPLLHKYKNILSEGLNTSNKYSVSLVVRKDVIPRYCNPKILPFAFIGRVEKIEFSDLGTPIVQVLKRDDLLCRDHKVTVNFC